MRCYRSRVMPVLESRTESWMKCSVSIWDRCKSLTILEISCNPIWEQLIPELNKANIYVFPLVPFHRPIYSNSRGAKFFVERLFCKQITVQIKVLKQILLSRPMNNVARLQSLALMLDTKAPQTSANINHRLVFSFIILISTV